MKNDLLILLQWEYVIQTSKGTFHFGVKTPAVLDFQSFKCIMSPGFIWGGFLVTDQVKQGYDLHIHLDMYQLTWSQVNS